MLGTIVALIFIVLLVWPFIASYVQKKISFKDKHLIITGGSSGIGFEYAKLVAKDGARITLMARRLEKLNDAKKEIESKVPSAKGNIQVVSVDVSDYNKVKAGVEEAVKGFGPPHALIASAGSAEPGYFLEQDVSLFERMVSQNYLGNVYLTKCVTPYMVENRAGHLVYVSSAVAAVGFFGYSSYGPTKAAVRNFAETLRNELCGFNIRVSVVYPPDTDTEGFQKENLTKPKETLEITPPSVYKAEQVAESMYQGISHGHFTVPGPDFLQNLIVYGQAGFSPRNHPLLEILLLTPLGIITNFLRWQGDSIAKKYGQNYRLIEKKRA